MSSWETELYRDLVTAELLTHIGQGNRPVKPDELPEGIKSGSKELSANQKIKLNEKLEELYQHILRSDEEGLWNIPNFDGDREQVKNLLWSVVSWATSNNKESVDEIKSKIESASKGDGVTDNEEKATDIEKTKKEGDDENGSGEDQDQEDSSGASSDSEEPKKGRGNLHVTSFSGGLKMELKNRAIIKHVLQADYCVLQVKDDDLKTSVLAEVQSVRPKRRGDTNQEVEYVSQFVVQRWYPATKAWCVEAVNQREISSAVKDWNKIKGKRWIHRPSEEKAKSFSREDLGDMVLHLACFYNVPKLRTAGTAKRSPPTRHILITSKEGLIMVNDGTFKRYIGNDEEANNYTAKSCERDKIPAPWDVDSQAVKTVVKTCHRPLSDTKKAGGIVQIPQQTTELSSPSIVTELRDRVTALELKFGQFKDLHSRVEALDGKVDQMMGLLQRALKG
ncbi:uncharacterized protein N7498_007857 [Penicillium cinerascens]|uniref:Uncharacterized protein n=1 Tax=Penicillium cinerascens TaxID=70096 RepID=A0A9W9JKP0_9EURO|nr:uncharacterized protein N7498_007857 [Penicillium cinerascens]KAJ5198740.1 hypothetical protein N7498_007857 [Penicillium cinerascens]